MKAAIIFLLGLILSTTSSAKIPKLDDFARNADGTVKEMVHSSEFLKSLGEPLPTNEVGAVEYCAVQGKRLPTARELGELAHKFGAYGNSDESPSGEKYKYIEAFGDSWQPDSFYYTNNGFKRPCNELGTTIIWANSIDEEGGIAYVLDFKWETGLSGAGRDNHLAVRCVSPD
jgi:hypothetical protein